VALEIVAAAIERLRLLAEQVLEEMPGREGFPAVLTQAIIGGIYHVFFEALKDEVDLETLTEPLWDWAISYPAPPVPLRLRGRRPKLPPPGTIPPYAFVDPAERIIRGFAAAVAQKGYQLTTIADIAARASISQRTLYEHFENKTEVLMAALDSSGMQLTAAVIPAIRRSPGWPESVRAATTATTRYFAAEPDFARLRQVEVYAAGTAAIAARDATAVELLQAATGDAEVASVHPVARQAILGAVHSVYYERITNRGTEGLAELAPLLAFVILAPFIGAEHASEVAVGNPHRPRAARSSL
jgi:AcrR family transcriptional regulator